MGLNFREGTTIYISSKNKNGIRNIEKELVSSSYTKKEKTLILWKVISPLLMEIKKNLINSISLSSEELDSELYICCYNIYKRYDPTRSSLVPYLANGIVWELEKLQKRLKKTELKEFLKKKKRTNCYYMQEEYYLDPLKILKETKYLKNFTKVDKFLILGMLLSENNELSKEKFAKKYKVTRPTMTRLINQLKENF